MITVCRQPVALGRIHAGRTVTVHVSEHTLAIELGDDTRQLEKAGLIELVAMKQRRGALEHYYTLA